MEKQKIIETIKNNKKYIIYIYCLINAIIFLLICSKCSFFYPFNNWDDPNSFFTMGKGMANGLIIYKDLFEQKGPILYLIHAIAYLISNDTFIGIYIFEIISFSIFLYYINKTITLYCKKIHIIWATPAISFIILSSYVFIGGDSAEEFCFPLLAITIYQMLNYFKNTYPNNIEKKQIILTGITAGCTLLIKYNLLGFWLGFMFFLCLGLIINKKIKETIQTILYFLLGMAITIIPWIIYFAINGALYDFINVYFIINITSYSRTESIIKKIIRALKDSLMYIKNLKYFTYITAIGYVYSMISKTMFPKIYGKIAITISILIATIGVYFGANHIYYFLILMPFVVLGLIFIAKMIEKIIKTEKINKIIYFTPIILTLFIILTCKESGNYNFHKTKKEELVQYQFAEIIKQQPNATLLNYGFLDGGFYTVTNIVPNIKYFHKPNIEYEKYPEIMDEQNRYIKEKITNFVIIRVLDEEESNNIPYLYENYEKIKTIYKEDINCYYMLFKEKSETNGVSK